MAKIRYLFTSFFLLLHSIRDLCQYLGKNNLFTKFGSEAFHKTGIKLANLAFKPFGYFYQPDHEIYYFYVEIITALIVFTCFILASKRKKYLRQITAFIDEHYYKLLILKN